MRIGRWSIRRPRTAIAAWIGFGMDAFGSPALVENLAPPYDGSHMLTTDLPPRTGTSLEYHNATVVDSATPLEMDGTPTFTPVWQYMMISPPALPRFAPAKGGSRRRKTSLNVGSTAWL